MALNSEAFELKGGKDLDKVKTMLSKSSVYVEINKIIDAYEQEQTLEKDELFSVENSADEPVFSVVKYAEAKGLLESGRLKKEVSTLKERLNSHKYFLAKNKEKDREALAELVQKGDKIKEFISLVETKNSWTKIIDQNFPNKGKNTYVHSLPYFIDIYKDLAINMEKICYRHLDDEHFAEKLGQSLENDMAVADGNSEEGKTDYQFILQARKAFIEALEANKQKYFPNAGKSNENEAEEYGD